MLHEPDRNAETVEEYVIRLQGILSDQWAEWFDGMKIHCDEQGNTTLTGAVVDQAALHGLLDKVRDLGMILISVTRMKSMCQDTNQEEML